MYLTQPWLDRRTTENAKDFLWVTKVTRRLSYICPSAREARPAWAVEEALNLGIGPPSPPESVSRDPKIDQAFNWRSVRCLFIFMQLHDYSMQLCWPCNNGWQRRHRVFPRGCWQSWLRWSKDQQNCSKQHECRCNSWASRWLQWRRGQRHEKGSF